MSFQKHCPGCFADKGGVAVCPVCQYDESASRSPLFLPHGIIIGGHFRIGRVLGQPGGFGITYLGWDIHLQQRVAIKEFLPRDIVTRHPGVLDVSTHTQETRSAFEFGKEQFLREARIVARLDHPNVVRVRSFFNAHDTAYLVMDYYEGLSLGDYLSRVRSVIEPALAVPLIRPVLDALQYVHEHGVVHRDLKPHNIYLATVGKPIVLDFGAARQAAGERVQSMSVVLTDGYAPLEQYQRRATQGPWTDVYGAAATLYRMLAGVAPPTALDRLTDDPLERGGWDKVPESLRGALRKALALKPEHRFQSAAEFIAALSDYSPFQVAAEPPVVTEPTAPEPAITRSDPPAVRTGPIAPLPESEEGVPFVPPLIVPARPVPPAERPAAPAPAAGAPATRGPRGDIPATAESVAPPVAAPASASPIPPIPAIVPEAPITRSEKPPLTRRQLPLLPPAAPGEAPPQGVQKPLAPAPRDGLALGRKRYNALVLGLPILLFAGLLAVLAVNWNRDRPSQRKPLSLRSTETPVAANAPPTASQIAASPANAPAAVAPLLPDMMPIEGGEFRIGEDVAGSAAAPAHGVKVSAYSISTTEITFEQFAQFVSQTGYRNPRWKNYPCESAGSRSPSWEAPGFPNSDSRPVVCVSWVDANAYAEWLGRQTRLSFRLPTEAEWEYAARGRSSGRYWWGDRYDDSKATCTGCPVVRAGPQPVKSWPPNAFGLYDTAGNVREWTCSSGEPYGRGTETRCAAVDVGGSRAVRGGSWRQGIDALRSAQRDALDGDRRDVQTGFRLVQDARGPSP
ncbi:SUMF1/EgtB/PvdO family nonheme iron enzyme [Hydrocarboniphaga effusa]|uniref:SUMF1/EgtB/PvdO family nonheme iron enzyme n=1 Tax=Hydrocarboniphaga effusa TaxID=243629 RepID=UPI00398BFB9F